MGAGARYKIISHVVLVESSSVGSKPGADGAAVPPRGAGVHVATRCLWDAAVDDLVSESLSNDAVTAVATAYAVYAY